MTSKPVIPRALAKRDVGEAVSHYLSDAAPQAAPDFIDALEAAYAHIARQPAAGSPRYAHELNLPELRVWPLRHFPYLMFYVERADHIDVWRLLHGVRGIPAWMREPAGF